MTAACSVAALDDALTVNLLSREVELNPLRSFTAVESQIYTALFEGLVSYHPATLQPQPAVAERWEISDDGTEYRFFLRDDARYWNGDRIVAQHFRDTWLALLEPSARSAYSFLYDVIAGVHDYRTGVTNDPDTVGIIAESAGVLLVRLVDPAPHFLNVLCHHSFVVLHPRMLRLSDENWYRLSTIISNGPYYIDDLDRSGIQLERNDLYWDHENVAIPRLLLQFNDDAPEVTRQFNGGSVDWAMSGMSLADVFDRDSIIVNAMFATSYFFFRASDAPWSDDKVRRALALLLPWDEIRSREFYNNPTHTLVPAIPDYPTLEGIQTRDVEEALRLLSEAGYPGGDGLGDIVIKIPDGEEPRRLAEIMGAAWSERLGIMSQIVAVEPNGYFDSLKEHDYTLGTLSWIGDFADPLTFLQLWTTESNLNESQFADDDYDALIWQSMAESGTQRYELLGKAERIVLDSGLVLPISHSVGVNLIDLQIVDGWYPNPLDIHPFKYLKFRARPPIPGVIELPQNRLHRLSENNNLLPLF